MSRSSYPTNYRSSQRNKTGLHKNSNHGEDLQATGGKGVAQQRLALADVYSSIAANRELERLKHDFLSRVSHELRTPLTTILAGSHLLAKGDMAQVNAQELAAKIEEQAKSLSQLVDAVLELAHADAETSVPQPSLLSLAPLVKQIVAQYSDYSDNHRIEACIPEDLPLVPGDRKQLARAIETLILNAIRYSPRGGTVTIEASAGDTFVCVAVTDEGIGIARERYDLVFQPFYRVQGAMNQRIKGAGLGLAICKHIIESHSGEIWVESKVGQGSTFFFTLPAVKIEKAKGLAS